ncbi:MAG: polyphosphate kinase 1 [Lachnospiraceae bacterium]|nr:polyphosphate kinase 1 [Lachnospiraceae bacterium]
MAKGQKRSENMKAGCYSNRELSWLKFNGRVLEEAADPRVPLAERLTFASIFQSNLDEFFMVRVGSLHDQMLYSPNLCENKTKMNSEEQIAAILGESRELCQEKDRIYFELMAQVQEQGGIELINFAKLSEEDAAYLEVYFNTEIRPLISPQVVGKRQPFPFLKNKEIYAVAALESKNSDKIGIVPCNNGLFDRLIQLKTEPNRFMLVEELILHFAPQIFDHYKIKSKSLLRVVRNADLGAEEESVFDEFPREEEADYRETMVELLKRRKKLCAVRAELSRAINEEVVEKLCEHLDLTKEQIFYTEAPLDLSFVFQLQDYLKTKPELFYERRVPQKSAMVRDDVPMMEQIAKKDILLCYPYESIQPFLRLLNEAADDPEVVSVKMTLYRVAKYSKVIEALTKAAENGKEVVVLVELRARFDEENNIEWSRRLEEAGCRIIYGLDGLKVHSKLCLITRKTKKKIQYITQIGTGNYNEKTSTLYTDYSLMTASTDIGLEALMVFNALSMGQICEPETKHLMVAPNGLRQGLIRLMDEEIAVSKKGGHGYIGVKLNSLTDKVLIEKLIEASQAGVKVDMVIRGICCLNPGIKGYTENITVISIVGRFLEHARIYMFGTGGRQKLYISSADFMTRNTIHRIEVAVCVEAEPLRRRITQMFKTMLSDNVKGRLMKPDGNYVRRQARKKEINSQELFYAQAYEQAEKAQREREEKEAKEAKKAEKPEGSRKSAASHKASTPHKTAEKSPRQGGKKK